VSTDPNDDRYSGAARPAPQRLRGLLRVSGTTPALPTTTRSLSLSSGIRSSPPIEPRRPLAASRLWRIASSHSGSAPSSKITWVTSKGGSYARFRRALETGNLTLVRAAAAELPALSVMSCCATWWPTSRERAVGVPRHPGARRPWSRQGPSGGEARRRRARTDDVAGHDHATGKRCLVGILSERA
jgi:hypothetical protein